MYCISATNKGCTSKRVSFMIDDIVKVTFDRTQGKGVSISKCRSHCFVHASCIGTQLTSKRNPPPPESLHVRNVCHDLVPLRVLAYVCVFGSHDSPENIINCYKLYTTRKITKQRKRSCNFCTFQSYRTFKWYKCFRMLANTVANLTNVLRMKR